MYDLSQFKGLDMKYTFVLFLVILAGCDTPTRSRFPTTGTGDALQTPTGTNLTPTTPTSPTTPVTVTPGFESCNLTTRNSTADLGNIAVCKSSQDETSIKFITSSSDSANRTCFIPTYKDTAGNSTYLGDPQCTLTEAEKTYAGHLYKNRTGMSQYPINGVMIMKEALLVEYYACMDAYVVYIQSNNYCRTYYNDPYCINAANQYRATKCNTFKTKYPNNYLDLYLR